MSTCEPRSGPGGHLPGGGPAHRTHPGRAAAQPGRPLYLLGAVALGYAATLGASVGLFQGLGGAGGLDFTLPIVLYLFVVAIGTDYNILTTARLREEFDAGHEGREAARHTVTQGG